MARPAAASAAHPSAPAAVGRFWRALAAAGLALAVGAALTACGTPTATPEPAMPTALPEPPTVVPATEVPVIAATATLTPTATATMVVPTLAPTAALVAPTTAAAPPTTAAQPTTAAPLPTAAPPTASGGAPVIEFYPDNGVFEVPKDQMCIAVNWRTENVTDVRLEWGGKAIAVAASGRQPDICFGEKKIELKLIYKLADGREETRTIEVKKKD